MISFSPCGVLSCNKDVSSVCLGLNLLGFLPAGKQPSRVLMKVILPNSTSPVNLQESVLHLSSVEGKTGSGGHNCQPRMLEAEVEKLSRV